MGPTDIASVALQLLCMAVKQLYGSECCTELLIGNVIHSPQSVTCAGSNSPLRLVYDFTLVAAVAEALH